MVSKAEYYRRKQEGLCVKCGKSREGSPSAVRCNACHTKAKKPKLPEEPVSSPQPSVSATHTTKPDDLKQNKVIDKQENIKVCRKCGETPLSFNLICQKCLSNTHFTKEEALARYGNCCSTCNHSDPQDLKIVSCNISTPVKYNSQQEMFRLVCYRRVPPPELRVLCHTCFWKENMAYIIHMRDMFDSSGVFEEIPDNTENEDIIDI